jgi:hypothetical protein
MPKGAVVSLPTEAPLTRNSTRSTRRSSAAAAFSATLPATRAPGPGADSDTLAASAEEPSWYATVSFGRSAGTPKSSVA